MRGLGLRELERSGRHLTMYDLSKFTLSEMTMCGGALRKLGNGAQSMEETAQRMVRYLHQNLVGGAARRPCCALVRFYKTHPCGELSEEEQRFARGLLAGHEETPEMKCLTLLASTGEKPEWNMRTASVGHRAIPLASEQMVERFPMISQLIQQFELALGAILRPDPALLLELDQKQYNVFYVPKAEGSAYIPAQEEFVKPFGIQSVLGFGGMLPSGNLFVIILFSKVPISKETAMLFRTLALSAKLAVLPFDGGRVFA